MFCLLDFLDTNRVPNDPGTRTQWINSIQSQHDCKILANTTFNVCVLHFTESEYSKRGSRFYLEPNVVPKVFNKRNEPLCESYEALCDLPESVGIDETHDTHDTHDTVHTVCLNSGKVWSNDEIQELIMEHRKVVNQFEHQVKKLTQKVEEKNDKLNSIRSKLHYAESQIQKFIETVAELKSNRYISSKLKDGTNVNVCSNFLT